MTSMATQFRQFLFEVFLFGGAVMRFLTILLSSAVYSLTLVLGAVLFTVEPNSVSFSEFLTGIQSPLFRQVVLVLALGIYGCRALLLGRLAPPARPQVS